MRILVLSKSLPFPPRHGLELPLAKIFEVIGKHHEVDILVISNQRDDYEARLSGVPDSIRKTYFLQAGTIDSKTRMWNEITLKRPAFFSNNYKDEDLRALASEFDYDVVWVSPPGNFTFIEACRRLGIGRFGLLVLGLNDLITSIYSKHLTEIYYRRIFDWRFLSFGLRSFFISSMERKYLYYFDLVHLQTPKEEQKAIQLLRDPSFKKRLIVSPNGTKEMLFKCVYSKNPGNVILMMTHLDGDRSGEALWFIQKVWPTVRAKTDAQLWLVGTPPVTPMPAIENDNRIKVKGYVPDLQALFEAVRLCVVPIFHNCGLINRIQDALAAGVPVVATAISAGTFPNLKNGKHLLTGNSPKDFTDQTILLYKDENLRNHLSAEGRKFAQTLPTWEETALKILDKINLM